MLTVEEDQAKKMEGTVHPACSSDLARGDMDGDGRSDAVFLYNVEGYGRDFKGRSVPGGSGTNISALIAAVLVDHGDRWSIGAQEQLGGRGPVKEGAVTSFRIAAGELVLDRLDYAEGDRRCCPSVKSQSRYRLEAGGLVEAKP